MSSSDRMWLVWLSRAILGLLCLVRPSNAWFLGLTPSVSSSTTTSSAAYTTSLGQRRQLGLQCYAKPKQLPLDENDDMEAEPWGSLEPTSDEAQRIVLDVLGCSTEQYDKLVALAYLITDWNERVNLVSRKDCTTATVFGRHILPCIALGAIKDETLNPLATSAQLRIVDVGTGGGFPGLPLSILYPQHEFVLLDSVGKKLTAVADMASQLDLDNHVTTHHGRAEDLVKGPKFHVATGRSVSDLSQFCAWMQHLLRPDYDNAQLLYWTGGALAPKVTDAFQNDWPLHNLIPDYLDFRTPDDPMGKRIVSLSRKAVQKLAKASGITVIRQNSPDPHRPKKPQQEQQRQHRAQNGMKHKSPDKATPARRKVARGAWQNRRGKRDDSSTDIGDQESSPKQRGYDNFQRYSSTGSP